VTFLVVLIVFSRKRRKLVNEHVVRDEISLKNGSNISKNDDDNALLGINEAYMSNSQSMLKNDRFLTPPRSSRPSPQRNQSPSIRYSGSGHSGHSVSFKAQNNDLVSL